MRDLPLVDAPNAKGKKFKEFFHLVEGVSPEDCDRIRTAMNTDPPSLNQLPDSVRPRDALGDSCILQLALSPDESGTYTVLKFFHSTASVRKRPGAKAQKKPAAAAKAQKKPAASRL